MTGDTRVTIERFTSARAFLGQAGDFLGESEAEYNLMLGVAHAMARAEATGGAVKGTPGHSYSQPFFLVARQGPQVQACAMRTPPHRLVVTRANAPSVAALADYCAEFEDPLPGANGPVETVRDFASTYAAKQGSKAKAGRAMRIFRLDQVIRPKRPASGRMRDVTTDDLSFLGSWIRAFGEELGDPVRDAEQAAAEGVEWGSLVVWEDACEPRAMAARTRPTPNGCGVNLVYTPPEYRNRGYASSLVADLSQLLLDLGYAFCFLYTDLANPTSNRIYKEIGYEEVADAEEQWLEAV